MSHQNFCASCLSKYPLRDWCIKIKYKKCDAGIVCGHFFFFHGLLIHGVYSVECILEKDLVK